MAQKKKLPAKSPAKAPVARTAKAPVAASSKSAVKSVKLKAASSSKLGKPSPQKSTAKPAAAKPGMPQKSAHAGSPSARPTASAARSQKATVKAPVKVAPSKTTPSKVESAKVQASKVQSSKMQANNKLQASKFQAHTAAKPAVKPTAVKPVATAAARAALAPAHAKPAVAQPVNLAAAVKKHPLPSQPARTVSSASAKQAIKTFPATVAPVVPRDIAAKTVDVRQQQTAAAIKAKPVNSRHGFKTNEFIVYPAHGVGRIVGIEEQEIAGMSLELFVIQFEKDKMTLRVPTGKLQSVGMRKLADDDIVKRSMETLKGRARVKRTMWSRRAQEYEAKINSGDLIAIAEVVRDLYRSESQPEQSYSERQLYEAALDRMAREIAAVERLDERGAVQRITEVLAKSAKGRRLAAEAAEAGEGADVKAA